MKPPYSTNPDRGIVLAALILLAFAVALVVVAGWRG